MKKNETNIPGISAKIERILDGDGSTKAFASLTLGNAFAVHGIRIVETEKGLRTRMPFRSYQSGEETKYVDLFHPITSEARQALDVKLIEAYYHALDQAYSEDEAPIEGEDNPFEKSEEEAEEGMDEEPEPAIGMSQQM